MEQNINGRTIFQALDYCLLQASEILMPSQQPIREMFPFHRILL